MRYSKHAALWALVAIATTLAPRSLDAQATKIGIIVTNQLLAESAAGVAAGAEFNAYVTEQQQPLLELESEIAVKTQQLEAQQLALSQTALATRTAELDRLQRQFTRGQEDYALNLELKQGEVLEPVYTLANTVIDQFAAEEGYHLIIDPTAAQGLLVYMNEVADVTLEVMRRMDEMYAAAQTGATTAAPAASDPAAAAQ